MDLNVWGKVIAVFVGSGLGGVCRWAVSQVCQTSWPAGTLVVNVVGCFLLGLLSRLMPGGEHMRLMLMTGFCGGFTTFSTFMNENLLMLRAGQLLPLTLYAAASLLLGLGAAAIGYRCL